MRINWVYAADYQIDPAVDIEQIKSIAPSWGSWRTWRSCNTDNVICHDLVKAQELIGRAFQAVANFYIPKSYYQTLNRPVGVKLYDGEFDQEADGIEDIVSVHLAGSISDLVLLAGFDFGPLPALEDKYQIHKLKNRHGLLRSVITRNPEVQWVMIDHTKELDKAYQNIVNLTCDTMPNVLKLLV